MRNLMEEYLRFTIKKIKKYMRTILATYYDEEIVKEYIKTYVNARYYNINHSEKNTRAFYLKIMDALNRKEKILLSKMDEDKKEAIDNTRDVFNFIFFFDNVRKVENFKSIQDLNDVIDQLVIMRKRQFKIRTQTDFKENFYKEIKSDMLEKDLYLDKLEAEEFTLNFLKHKTIDNLYYVDLDYSINLPVQYSQIAIDKVYNSGIVAEDKLLVEYTLLSVVVIRDILNADFKDKYIVEFTTSLFNKKQKLDTVLNIINNQALQDKINLNITYEELRRYKKIILEYINRGYNFAITLDNSLKDVEDVEKLKIFRTVIVPKNLHLYKEIMRRSQMFSNVIEQ